VAILDSRIIARSYGVALLNALGPTLRIQQPSQLFNQSQAESGLS
jgi:ATP-dependent DNA helicase DinG